MRDPKQQQKARMVDRASSETAPTSDRLGEQRQLEAPPATDPAAFGEPHPALAAETAELVAAQDDRETLPGKAEHLLRKYSEMVACQAQLRREHDFYARLFEQAPIADVLTDAQGTIFQANVAAGRLLGPAPTALQGRSLLEFATAEGLAVLHATLYQLRQAGGRAELELSLFPEHPASPISVATHSRRTVIAQLDASLGQAVGQELVRWQLYDASAYAHYQSEQARQLELAQLSADLIQRIHQSLSPPDILNNAVTELLRVLQADRVLIYRVDDDRVTAIAEAVGLGWRPLLGHFIEPSSQAYVSELYERDRPVILADVNGLAWAPTVTEMLRQQQIQAMVTVPILDGESWVGLLAVHQCGSVRTWQAWETTLVQRVAEQLAIALHHSELYQHAQQVSATLEQDVRRRTEQMGRILKYESMLKRITDRVRDSLDQNQILQAAVQELTLVLNIAGCNASLYDLDQNTSTILYEYTSSVPAFYGKVARMEDSPEIYHQLKAGHSFQFCSLYPNPVRGSVAMLACPIFVDPQSSEGIEHTVLGDLWLIHEKDYVFNVSEIRLVQQVANQCAIAIRQARLYRAAKAQVEELEHLNQLKDHFLSTVSHELRTPIANLKMAIHMLEISKSPEKQAQYLKILKNELARESDLINDLLDLQRLEQSRAEISLEVIDLQTWLPELVKPFHSRLQSYQQHLQLDCAPDVRSLNSDPSILQRILIELLNNACKYTVRESAIELSVTAQTGTSSHAPEIMFILRNQAEIPAEELPHIFEKFYRVTQVDRYKHGGTGLGLALVKKLAEELGGHICATSQDGWTTFTLVVPSHPLDGCPKALQPRGDRD